ncbi:unnamed protein product [Zymoseptoria tritici ST99CH_1E4]|uniref:DUF7730 domain-containing protein n=1 Tax=Zymoseptoria tritici ST99CH_1E4 TaxID=1276532 RepID=A0A2H1GYA2_ZYMTR|nr:unnamed protein product [Zymoseptoria tritici ST99CH_1E4]
MIEDHANMTPTTPSTRCRLLELPRELRDTIYEYAFIDTIAQLGQHSVDPPATPPTTNVFLACRQVYDKSADDLHRHRYHFHSKDIRDAIKALSQLSPQDFMRIRLVQCVHHEDDMGMICSSRDIARLKTNLAFLHQRARPSQPTGGPVIEIVRDFGEALFNSEIGNMREYNEAKRRKRDMRIREMELQQTERMRKKTEKLRKKLSPNKFFDYQSKQLSQMPYEQGTESEGVRCGQHTNVTSTSSREHRPTPTYSFPLSHVPTSSLTDTNAMSKREPPARRSTNIKLEAQQKSHIKPEPTQTPPPESRLLALPTELRLKVYEHLFTKSLIHVSARNRLSHPSNPHPDIPRLIFTPSTTDSPQAHPKNKYIHSLRSPSLGILSTCHLFRKEALPIFYATATFQITGTLEVGLEWLGSLTVQEKKTLKELRLKTHGIALGTESDFPSVHEVCRREKRCLQWFDSDRRFRGVGIGVLKVRQGKFGGER